MQEIVVPEAERVFIDQFQCHLPDVEAHLRTFEALKIPYQSLRFLREIGRGQYGAVNLVKQRGKSIFTPLAAKEVDLSSLSAGELGPVHQALLVEAHILHEMAHPQVWCAIEIPSRISILRCGCDWHTTISVSLDRLRGCWV